MFGAARKRWSGWVIAMVPVALLAVALLTVALLPVALLPFRSARRLGGDRHVSVRKEPVPLDERGRHMAGGSMAGHLEADRAEAIREVTAVAPQVSLVAVQADAFL